MKIEELNNYVGKYIKYTSDQTERDGHGPWLGRVWPIREDAEKVEINGSLHLIESIKVIEELEIEKVKLPK